MNLQEEAALARRCWTFAGPLCPSLKRLKEEGRMEEAKSRIIAEAFASLQRLGAETVSSLDMCWSIEGAAKKYLDENPNHH